MIVFSYHRDAAIGAFLLISLMMFHGCRHNEPQTETREAVRHDKAERRERGAQVIAEYLKRDAAPYRRSRVRLTITSTTEPVKVYELEVSRKQTADETLTLTQLVQPASENDLASLTIERKGQSAINVTYTATGQFRETGTNKMFFGGLTAQELLGEWDKYDYRLLSEKEVNGTKAFEVEGTLKPSANSNIARFTTLFRADTYLPAESHLFSSDGRELRTFQFKDYHAFAGRTVASRIEIENHVRDTQVIIEVLSLSFPDRMGDEIFTREWLKRLASEREKK
ncbi:MAG: outer membrane lipoprotein-sorting protein [Acidobacteria bacterium]|nr:outer membrane lipoprotein-sorting protein [Acidobacteriota bacterium]